MNELQGVRGDEPAIESLARDLMSWLRKHSRYRDEFLTLPAIKVVSAVEITRRVYASVGKSLPESGADNRILGFYDFDTGSLGTIYVLPPSEGNVSVSAMPKERKVYFEERLLHELIHYAQRASGVWDKAPCRAYNEREAYILGGRYLRQQRVRDPFPNRLVLAMVNSRCRSGVRD